MISAEQMEIGIRYRGEGRDGIADWEGVFDGIRQSEHDPDQTFAYFRDGRIGTTAQGLFGKPVHRVAGERVDYEGLVELDYTASVTVTVDVAAGEVTRVNVWDEDVRRADPSDQMPLEYRRAVEIADSAVWPAWRFGA